MLYILGYAVIGGVVGGVYVFVENKHADSCQKLCYALLWPMFALVLLVTATWKLLEKSVRVRSGHGEGGTDGKTGEGGGCCGRCDERQHQSRQKER